MVKTMFWNWFSWSVTCLYKWAPKKTPVGFSQGFTKSLSLLLPNWIHQFWYFIHNMISHDFTSINHKSWSSSWDHSQLEMSHEHKSNSQWLWSYDYLKFKNDLYTIKSAQQDTDISMLAQELVPKMNFKQTPIGHCCTQLRRPSLLYSCMEGVTWEKWHMDIKWIQKMI
jgi:hypothetical protein